MIITSVPLLSGVVSELLLSVFVWIINWVLSLILQLLTIVLSFAINFFWSLVSGELISGVDNSSIGSLIKGDLFTAAETIGTFIAIIICLFQLVKLVQSNDGSIDSPVSILGGFALSVAALWTLPKPLFKTFLYNNLFVHTNSVFKSISSLIETQFSIDAVNSTGISGNIDTIKGMSDEFVGGIVGEILEGATWVLDNFASVISIAVFCVIMFFVLKFLGRRCINLTLSILNRLALVYILIFACPMAMGTIGSKSTRQTFAGWLKLYLGNIVSLFFSLSFVQVAFNVIVNSFGRAATASGFISALIEIGIGLVLIEIVINIESYVQQLALGGVNTAHMMTYVARDLMGNMAGMGGAIKSMFSSADDALDDYHESANDEAIKEGARTGGVAGALAPIGAGIGRAAGTLRDKFIGNGLQDAEAGDGGKTLNDEGKSTSDGTDDLRAKAGSVDAYNQAHEDETEETGVENDDRADGQAENGYDDASAAETTGEATESEGVVETDGGNDTEGVVPDNINYRGDGTYAVDENGVMQKVDENDVDADGRQNTYDADGNAMSDDSGAYVKGSNGNMLDAKTSRMIGQGKAQAQSSEGKELTDNTENRTVPDNIDYRGAGIYAADKNGIMQKAESSDVDENSRQNRYNEQGKADTNGDFIKGENGEMLNADSMQSVGAEAKDGTHAIPDEGRFVNDGNSYYRSNNGNYGTSSISGAPVKIPDEALNPDGSIKSDARVDDNGNPDKNGEYVAAGFVQDEKGTYARNMMTNELEAINPEAFDGRGNIKPEKCYGANGEIVKGVSDSPLYIGAYGEGRYSPELVNVANEKRSNMFDPSSERIPAETGESGLWQAQKAATINSLNQTRGQNSAFVANASGSYAKDGKGDMYAISPAAIRSDGTIAPQALRSEAGNVTGDPEKDHYVYSAGGGAMLDVSEGRFSAVAQSQFASDSVAVLSDTGNMLPDENGVSHAITKSLDSSGHIKAGVQRYDGRGYETVNGAYIQADDGTMVAAFTRTANGVAIPASEVLEEGKTRKDSVAGRGFEVSSTEIGASGGRSTLVSGTSTAMDNAGSSGNFRMAQAPNAIGHTAAVAYDMDGNVALVPDRDVVWRTDGSAVAADKSRISAGNAGYFYTASNGMQVPCEKDGQLKNAGRAFERSYSHASGVATYAESVSGDAVDVSNMINIPGGSRVKDDAQFVRQTTHNGNPVFENCSMSEASHVAVPTSSGETYVPVNVTTDSAGHSKASIDQTYQSAHGSVGAQQIASQAATVSGYAVQNKATGEVAQTVPVVAYDPARNSVYNPQTRSYSMPTVEVPKGDVNTNSPVRWNIKTGIFSGSLSHVRRSKQRDKADVGIYSATMKTFDGKSAKVEMYDANSSKMAELWKAAKAGKKQVHGYVPRENGDVGYWIVSDINNGRKGNSKQK